MIPYAAHLRLDTRFGGLFFVPGDEFYEFWSLHKLNVQSTWMDGYIDSFLFESFSKRQTVCSARLSAMSKNVIYVDFNGIVTKNRVPGYLVFGS